ncbi:uncharacterized protein LOC143021430 [Oratosquilla oratoria]|uniref:uncharacterized protein LOC143021430 n=1 Tax=Oratosquilla oratoria TaxID=337810 RepID=UPI003F7761BA
MRICRFVTGLVSGRHSRAPLRSAKPISLQSITFNLSVYDLGPPRRGRPNGTSSFPESFFKRPMTSWHNTDTKVMRWGWRISKDFNENKKQFRKQVNDVRKQNEMKSRINDQSIALILSCRRLATPRKLTTATSSSQKSNRFLCSCLEEIEYRAM